MGRSARILIVEDNPDDYEACATALQDDTDDAQPIQWCRTGREALDYLRGQGRYADAAPALPSLVLMDLNMPGMDGREALARIKADPAMRKIPVVVMTSSGSASDIDACYDAGASSYVVKPSDLQSFLDTVVRLRDYWFQTAALPGVR